jgi:branched-chain amino acid transport system ATP-binding protein
MVSELVNSSEGETPAGTDVLLRVDNLSTGYGTRPVIEDISIALSPGEAVGIIGHNGAGKTTLMRAIYGTLKPTKGSVHYRGVRLEGDCKKSIAEGMAFVPAEDFVFATLSVNENLLIARRNARTPAIADAAEEAGKLLFPVVWERRAQLAGTLSGGERRMLSIAMSLMWEPQLLLLDEPTVGLAPALAERVFDALGVLSRERGLSILCVEQSVVHLLRLVERVYILRDGRLMGEESAASLLARQDYWDLF